MFGAVELLGQGQLAGSEIGGDLVVVGRIDLDGVPVVHGPPGVILEPLAGAEVVEIDDPVTDGLAGVVEGVHRHVEVVRLGSAVGDHGRAGDGGDGGLDLLGHFDLMIEIDVAPVGRFLCLKTAELQIICASQVN